MQKNPHPVLVTGANGQLGSCLRAIINAKCPKEYHFFFTDIAELDITNTATVRQFISEHHIKTIINTAAYTAVDKAESEIALATALNDTAVASLAQIAKELSMLLIHISTDYVFNGWANEPYAVTAATCPLSVYGKTKLAGEQAILKINPKSLIIRTSWLYSIYGSNFVKTMLRLGKESKPLRVVQDQLGAPTSAHDLAEVLIALLPQAQTVEGAHILHYANAGATNWYDFAYAIMQFANLCPDLQPISTPEYPTPAPRPTYSVLDTSKIEAEYGISIPHWKNSLLQVIKEYETIDNSHL